jgi:hypothetical protein
VTGGDDWNSAPGWEDADFDDEKAPDITDSPNTDDIVSASTLPQNAADQHRTARLAAVPEAQNPHQSTGEQAVSDMGERAMSDVSSDTQYDSCSDTEAFEAGVDSSPPGARLSPVGGGGKKRAQSPASASESVRKPFFDDGVAGAGSPRRRRVRFGGGGQRSGDSGSKREVEFEDMDRREGSLGPSKGLWLLKSKRRVHEPLTQVSRNPFPRVDVEK